MDRLDWVRILPPWLFPLAATAVGLILGSFANVCIHRLPRGQSVVWARSECPRCGAGVRASHSLPSLGLQLYFDLEYSILKAVWPSRAR